MTRASKGLTRASKGLTSASKGLTRAKKGLTRARKGLTRARKDDQFPPKNEGQASRFFFLSYKGNIPCFITIPMGCHFVFCDAGDVS